MRHWIRLLVVLNLVDLVSTFISVCVLGIATEANPLMKACIDTHPLVFVLVKTVLGCVVPIVLYPRLSTSVPGRIGVMVAVWIYVVLALTHLYQWVFGFVSL